MTAHEQQTEESGDCASRQFEGGQCNRKTIPFRGAADPANRSPAIGIVLSITEAALDRARLVAALQRDQTALLRDEGGVEEGEDVIAPLGEGGG